MSHLLHYHPITVTFAIVIVLAMMKGGAPERIGALLMGVDWLCELGVDSFLKNGWIAISPTIVLDALLAGGLLVLALRYGKLWLGFTMIMQSLTLALHAMALSDDAPGYNLYATLLNVTTCMTSLGLLAGTVTAWRRRVVTRSHSPKLTPAPT